MLYVFLGFGSKKAKQPYFSLIVNIFLEENKLSFNKKKEKLFEIGG
jgi:hypothetical protein